MTLKPKLGFILACIFLDALGIGLIVPVLPRLIGTLTHSAETQATWYGALMLSYGLMQFICSPVLGALSDRIGRRPVLLGGIFGLGIMFAIPAFSDNLIFILISRIIGGMLAANMAVAQAYIADITQGNARSAGFGKIGAVFGIGFVLGPALGGILGQQDPTLPFTIAAGVSFINFLYGVFVLPESLPKTAAKTSPWQFNNPLACIGDLWAPSKNRALVATLVIASLVNGLTQCTWALYTEYRYGFTPLQIGLSVFALGLSISFVQGYLLQHALRIQTPEKITLIALSIGVVCLLSMGVSSHGLLTSILFCFYATAGAVSPLLTGAISRQTPLTKQGKAIGSLSALTALSGAIAPALGTPLLMFTSEYKNSLLAGIPFYFCALLLALALLIYFNTTRHTAPNAQNFPNLPLEED